MGVQVVLPYHAVQDGGCHRDGLLKPADCRVKCKAGRSEVSWRTGSKLITSLRRENSQWSVVTGVPVLPRALLWTRWTNTCLFQPVRTDDQQSADPASESDVNTFPSWERVKRFQKNLCHFLYFIFIFLFELLSLKFPQSTSTTDKETGIIIRQRSSWPGPVSACNVTTDTSEVHIHTEHTEHTEHNDDIWWSADCSRMWRL